ncbi:hypothetical protein G6F42_015338 [Rhizopus arrhizus]|nr:hypothetical protein G6F42_015338 [Rhizopus arrhizus]
MTGHQETFTGYAGLEPFVLKDEKTHLQVYEFEPRPLDADEVEIQVSACGICGSDVHQLTNVRHWHSSSNYIVIDVYSSCRAGNAQTIP